MPIKHSLLVFSQPLHDSCIQKSKVLTAHQAKEVFEAIVCGKSLQLGSETLQIFLTLGLIHILIVSGSHYTTLYQILRFIKVQNQILIFLALLLFTSMTLFQPPGGKAFVSFFLATINLNFRLSKKPAKLEVLSGLICLAIFPDWINSLSFHLSWSLSLLLCLLGESSTQNWFSNLLKLFVVQVFASLLIGSFGQLSLFTNFFIAPLFSLFLFPFGLLVLILPDNITFAYKAWNSMIPIALEPLSLASQLSKVFDLPFLWPQSWLAVSSLSLIFLSLYFSSKLESKK